MNISALIAKMAGEDDDDDNGVPKIVTRLVAESVKYGITLKVLSSDFKVSIEDLPTEAITPAVEMAVTLNNNGAILDQLGFGGLNVFIWSHIGINSGYREWHKNAIKYSNDLRDGKLVNDALEKMREHLIPADKLAKFRKEEEANEAA